MFYTIWSYFVQFAQPSSQEVQALFNNKKQHFDCYSAKLFHLSFYLHCIHWTISETSLFETGLFLLIWGLFAETSFGYKQTAFLITLSVYKMFKKIRILGLHNKCF